MKHHLINNPPQGKKYTMLLCLLLIVGLLTHSVVLWMINCMLNPVEVSSQLLLHRLMWRKFAEAIFACCSAAYCLGQIILLYHAVKKKKLPLWRNLLAHCIVQLFIILACVLPFGLIDRGFVADYLLPAWTVAGLVVVLTAVWICCSSIVRKSKNIKKQ